MRVLDLFCGAGGSSVGAEMAGGQIVAGIDRWNVASDCYSKNFPSALCINEDIRDVSPERLREAIGSIDMLLASPECTSHSCARGARVRSEDSSLTAYEVTRFAKVFRPKWILVENVVQMRSWSGYAELLAQLSALGYFVSEEILNARDFGVPQSRRRLFHLCSLLGPVRPLETPNREYKPARSVIDFDGSYSFAPLHSPTRAKRTLERAERAMAELGREEPFLIVYYGTDSSGGWQSIQQPLRTVTTLDRFAFVRHSPKGHIMRMLQPEELKLAMGFPSSYMLDSGNRRDRIRLMGNAVCPPVVDYAIRWVMYSNDCGSPPSERDGH